MTISKTTVNFAARRGLDLVERDGLVEVFAADNDCEPMFVLRTEGDQFFWHGNVYLKQSIKEEVPAWIKSESELRKALAFVASELSA